MAYEETNQDYSFDVNGKLRDIEEKQNLTRDRVLLIGKNLIESREKTKEEISELKLQIDKINREVERLRDTVQSMMEEFDNFARKSDVESVEKQLELFSPLEFARMEDVEKMIHKHKVEKD